MPARPFSAGAYARAFRKPRVPRAYTMRGAGGVVARHMKPHGTFTRNYRVFGAAWDFPAAGTTPGISPEFIKASKGLLSFMRGRGVPTPTSGKHTAIFGPFMLTIDESKVLFFDRPIASRLLTPYMRAVYSRFGAYVRSDARNSMRKAPVCRTWMRHGPYAGWDMLDRAPSAPGTPPHTRVGYVKKFLYFSLDPDRLSVVIGPRRLPGVGLSNGYTVPAILEFGPRTGAHHGVYYGVPYCSVHPARPYMKPAMDKNMKKMRSIMRMAAQKVGKAGGAPWFTAFSRKPNVRMNM